MASSEFFLQKGSSSTSHIEEGSRKEELDDMNVLDSDPDYGFYGAYVPSDFPDLNSADVKCPYRELVDDLLNDSYYEKHVHPRRNFQEVTYWFFETLIWAQSSTCSTKAIAVN